MRKFQRTKISRRSQSLVLLLIVKDFKLLGCLTFLEGLEKSYHNTPGYVCLRDIGHSKKKMMVAVINSEEGSSTTGNSLISVLNVAVLELSVGICASGNHL